MSEYTYGTYACQVIVGYDQWGGSLADRPRKSLAPETRLRLCIGGYGDDCARGFGVRRTPLHCTAALQQLSATINELHARWEAGRLVAWNVTCVLVRPPLHWLR